MTDQFTPRTNPKIAIIGTGSMGGVYAGLFAEAGFNVIAIDACADHIAAITENGLMLTGASGDRLIKEISASTDLSDAHNADIFIIATKAGNVGDAAAGIAQIAKPDALVMTIQNGLGAAERISAFMALDQVLLGVAEGFGASIKAPGHIHHNNMRQIRIGEVNGGITPRLAWVESLWQKAGFKATAFADINQLIWDKYICNVMLSAPCCVYDCTVGDLFSDPERRDVAMKAMLEAYEIGIKKDINFSFDDPVAYATSFAEGVFHASPSMRLDHLAGRKSEIDAINGMVPVLGEAMGIKTPVNDWLVAEVLKKEEGFE